MHLARTLFASFLLVSAAVLPLTAQVDRATLNGTVTDASGAVIPGARIVLVAPATGLNRETKASSTGDYNITGLPIGTYNITFSHAGFDAVEIQGLTLSVGQVRTLDAHMAVGSVTSQIEVRAPAIELNRTSAEIGGVIGSQQVRSIPLNGRNWADLMLLVPGAIDAGSGVAAISTTSVSPGARR